MLRREKLLTIALLSSKINRCPMLLFLAVHAPICPLSKLHKPTLGEGIESQTPGLTHSTDHPKDMRAHTLTLLDSASIPLTLTQNQDNPQLDNLYCPSAQYQSLKAPGLQQSYLFTIFCTELILPDLLGNEFIIPLTAWKECTALIIILYIFPGFSL